MGWISDFVSDIKEYISKIFVSDAILDLRQRQQFKQEMLDITRGRLQFVIAAVILIQVVNLIGIFFFDLHRGYKGVYCIGSAFLFIVGILCSLALETIRKKAAAVGFRTKNWVVHGSAILIILGLIIFIYGDFSKNQSSISLLLLVVAISLVPTMDFKVLLLYMVPVTAIAMIIGVSRGVTAYALVQSMLLALICIYASQVRYSYAVKHFQERQRLSATNLELERLSETDQLTNILNRRGLERHVKHLAASHRRSGENICMLMVDIDLFKQYNDKYYHSEGDRCLSLVADCLRSNAKRSTDIVARYGGEEFVLVCLDMKASELVSFALKLKTAVEDMEISLGRSSSRVTVSIGAAMIEMEDNALSDEAVMSQLFNMSDHELYNAKESGRNCISYRGHIHR
ncbi:MAG: GGDEF domain-containing protein [Christensenellales bacterium]|jgi:diguanylate cyclase (GGDEF)-like protein